MKLAISYAVMVVPILVVVFGAGDRLTREKLKYIGLALGLSGLCTSIGVKFFGLYAIGRHSRIEGDRALFCALFLMGVGLSLYGIHRVIAWVRTRRRERG